MQERIQKILAHGGIASRRAAEQLIQAGRVRVNGKVVMRLFGPQKIDGPALTPVTSGPIILQSEGSEIFYRDVAVQSIKAVPAEYRA